KESHNIKIIQTILFDIQNKNQNHNLRRLFYADKNKKNLVIIYDIKRRGSDQKFSPEKPPQH
ncbi:hypothetical protein, partial [Escherichia coli]|uniref:hypothetical protein n=1 Tax=Escherichia coli TaxID=562 RepID=UPI001BAF1040